METAATTVDETKDPVTLLFEKAKADLCTLLEGIGKFDPAEWGKEEYVLPEMENYHQMLDIAKKEESKLLSRVRHYSENWIKGHLTQQNISKIKSIYYLVLSESIEESSSQVSPWWVDHVITAIEGMCRALCKPYLLEVVNSLEDINLAMMKALNDHNKPSNSQLLVIGQREYDRVCQHISSKEIQGLVQIGYEKLMRAFTSQNDIIQDMIKVSISSYKEQLAREKFDSPAKLKVVHSNLEMMVSQGLFKALFSVKFQKDSKLTLDIDIPKKVDFLKELIQAEYLSHLQAKQNNLKHLQDEMSELMSKATIHHQVNQSETAPKKERASEEEKGNPNEIDQRAHRVIDDEDQSSSQKEPKQGKADSVDYIHDRQPSCDSFESARQELLAKCEDINSKLEEGNTFNIKSAVTKKLFMIKIEDAIKLAGERTATRQQFQDQMEVLDTWSKKYKK